MRTAVAPPTARHEARSSIDTRAATGDDDQGEITALARLNATSDAVIIAHVSAAVNNSTRPERLANFITMGMLPISRRGHQGAARGHCVPRPSLVWQWPASTFEPFFGSSTAGPRPTGQPSTRRLSAQAAKAPPAPVHTRTPPNGASDDAAVGPEGRATQRHLSRLGNSHQVNEQLTAGGRGHTRTTSFRGSTQKRSMAIRSKAGAR